MNRILLRKRRLTVIAAALVLAAAITTDAARVLSARNSIRTGFLRLHVIAASDSPQDQRLKLAVRDAVLAEGAAIFDGSMTVEQAESRLTPRLSALKFAAERTLRRIGCRKSVRVELKKEYFPERTYEDVTLPPGIYTGVKVTIGEGEGHNWWCVIFPPMCLPESSCDGRELLSDGERDVLTHPAKYRLRFKTAEICEKLVEKLKDAFSAAR